MTDQSWRDWEDVPTTEYVRQRHLPMTVNDFDRWLTKHDGETERSGAVKALRRFADYLEGSAEWTENNFLPGPNSTPYIFTSREIARDMREEADDIEGGESIA